MPTKVHLLQSGYTSDPYEPSETLTYGAFSTRLRAEKACVRFVSRHIVGLADRLKAPSKYPSAEHDDAVRAALTAVPAIEKIMREWARMSPSKITAYPYMKKAILKVIERAGQKLSDDSSAAWDQHIGFGKRAEKDRDYAANVADPRSRRWRCWCDLINCGCVLSESALGIHSDSFQIVNMTVDQLASAPVQTDREDDDD